MTAHITKFAIIVAGGTGTRMQSILPKQYLLLDNTPVLMYSIRAFYDQDPHTHIIVVIADQMRAHWQNLCREHEFDIKHTLVIGGTSRVESVHNALVYIAREYPDVYERSLIAVHDGARPLIEPKTIENLFHLALTERCVVPAIPSVNSIRFGTRNKSKMVDRDMVWQIQTPQVFNGAVLVESYQQAMEKEDINSFTDDASVVEEMGNTIYLQTGNHRNIKITYPEDINIALIYLDVQRKRI